MKTEGIIKQAKTHSRSLAPGGIIKQPVIAARVEAKELLAQAANEALTIIQQAEQRAHQVREEAYQEGYRAGFAEFNQRLLDANERYDRALADAEPDILRLAVKIAKKIIGREIESDPATVAEIVKTALGYAERSQPLTLRVNPADLPALQTCRNQLEQSAGARAIGLIADPGVSIGGCVIETESGTIDARLETQLRVLEAGLLSL
jgi:type III secretion protein L